MSVNLSHEEDSSRVQLTGVIDIADAADLKTALMAALEHGKAVEVTLSAVSSLDVTAVQLLWAAQREARQAAVVFTFAGSLSEPASAVLNDTGFKELFALS